MNKTFIFLIVSILLLSSCALFKRNRMVSHKGIERKEFNLPIFIYPSKKPLSKKLIVFLSGDGGWIKFEDELALKFAENGFQTIGINSRSYFWEQKSPAEAGADFTRLIRKYALLYKTDEIYLCGYSFGADVLPFIYNQLPNRAKRHIVSLSLLSPFATTDFMVHFSDLTNTGSDNYPYQVAQEVQKLFLPVYCFYGIDEQDKPLKDLPKVNFNFSLLKGNHHYEQTEYDKIVSVFLKK